MKGYKEDGDYKLSNAYYFEEDDFEDEEYENYEEDEMETTGKPKCKLVGTDGNVFSLIGKVRDTLRKAGMGDAAKEMTNEVMSCGSYDEALQIFMKYVDVR